MPEQLKLDLMDLGGGHVDGIPASHLRDNQFANYQNFYPYLKKAVRRKGMLRVTETAHAERLTSIFALKNADGTWTLVLGRQTGLSKLDGTGLVDLPISDSTAYATQNYLWGMKQYKDVGYAVRRGTGSMKRFTSEFIQNAGIAAPGTAPTLAQGAAGALPAGNYYGVYTFYNNATGVESNPSDASAVLALAASKKINWSGIAISTSGQVTSRRLYRTLGDQTGEYYFVAQIDNNFDTTYTDNVVTDDLGRQVSFDNGEPPDNARLIEFHKERCFLSDGTDVFFGEIGLAECFAEDSIIQVYPDDGHEIRVLLSWGDRLVIGKTNAVHYLVGTDRSSFALQTLSNRHGMFAQGSAKVIEGSMFWYGGDDFYRSDGGSPQPIGRERIRAILDNIPDGQKEDVVAAVVPELGWYMATVPQGSSSTNQKVVVYNYRSDTWCVFTHPTDAPGFVGDFFDTNYGPILYAVLYDGHVYQYHTGNDDYGNAISAVLLGKERAYDQEGMLKGMRRLHILASTVEENITTKVYKDGSATAASNRTTTLNQARPWKRLSASTMGNLGASLQIGLEYSGAAQIEIAGIVEELAAFRRAPQPV